MGYGLKINVFAHFYASEAQILLSQLHFDLSSFTH